MHRVRGGGLAGISVLERLIHPAGLSISELLNTCSIKVQKPEEPRISFLRHLSATQWTCGWNLILEETEFAATRFAALSPKTV